MNTKDTTPKGEPEALRPMLVKHRRHSGLPLIIPASAGGTDPQEVRLKVLEEKFKGTTPQEREILRKIGFAIEQGLLKAGLGPAQKPCGQATPPATQMAENGANETLGPSCLSMG